MKARTVPTDPTKAEKRAVNRNFFDSHFVSRETQAVNRTIPKFTLDECEGSNIHGDEYGGPDIHGR